MAKEVSSFALAAAQRLIGSYQVRRGDFVEGINKLKLASIHFEQMRNYNLTSEIYNDIGHGFFLDGQFDEAKVSYERSLEIGKIAVDQTSSYNGELGLGKTHIALGDTSLGLFFINRYKENSVKDKKYEAAADSYAYLAMIAEQQSEMDLSHELYLKSYQNSLKSKSKIHFTHALNNRAVLFFDAGEIDSALFCFKESLRLREELSNPKPVVESYYNLASFFQLVDEPIKAKKNFEYALDLASSHSFIQDEVDAIDALLYYNLSEDSIGLKKRKKTLVEQMANKKGLDEEVILFVFSDVQKESNMRKDDDSTNNEVLWIAVIILFALTAMYFLQRKV